MASYPEDATLRSRAGGFDDLNSREVKKRQDLVVIDETAFLFRTFVCVMLIFFHTNKVDAMAIEESVSVSMKKINTGASLKCQSSVT